MNGKMNLNILFMQQKSKAEKIWMWNEWNWMKQQKAAEIPQQQLSSLDIYHTLCLSAIAIFYISLPLFFPSDIYSLPFLWDSDTKCPYDCLPFASHWRMHHF